MENMENFICSSESCVELVQEQGPQKSFMTLLEGVLPHP